MSGRYRNWCFTLNNPTDMEKMFWQKMDEFNNENDNLVQYLVLQEEKGHDEDTFHLQGYIELSVAKGFQVVRRMFSMRAHWERRAGSQSQAITYCKKQDTRVENGLVVEFGTPKRTGRAGKFCDAVEALKGGMSLAELADQYSTQYAMWKDKLDDFGLSLKGKRTWAMEVLIFVGPSGTGKSYTASREPDTFPAPWPTGQWWWPGYRGENCVILDEFRHQIKMDVMLKMLDRYTWHLEAKGRNFQFVSHKIIITTNIDPKDWYPKLSVEKKAPLARRIQEFAKIYDFGPVTFGPNGKPVVTKALRTEAFEFNEPLNPQVGGYNGRGGGYGQGDDRSNMRFTPFAS